MADFILQLFIFLSFGVVVYLVARALPRVPDDAKDEVPEKTHKGFLSSFPAHKVDLAIASFFEKVLRRARLVVLRLDNVLNAYIGKVKSHAHKDKGNNKQKSLFSSSGDNSERES